MRTRVYFSLDYSGREEVLVQQNVRTNPFITSEWKETNVALTMLSKDTVTS